ncbi:uridine kinase [Clostridium botulinum]|uniref:Uridine kinase n=1 Tax=Clostridium botulinum (strain Hall / ATCC 3502 / NCTC 13319 / Type A) TaxID=441771 RepID=A5I4Y5_CLOBH|nr:uridine kinase [Clostridium botulinum]ABS32872.1 uridine kinase [Clostridium botulinum A str. ATCC 19397]ABS38156.1 uridine kinase [Clostridium botulinum A str. Hall]AWB18338.1 uridine kinase [Clostridium botulinum]EGT5615325.1 uridine kinase [Clostridium botulinum]EGT5622176.1 uridine kinase [Clostridium botulinum]
MKRPVLIGIAGGTGSGKSTVAKEIYNKFDEACIAMIEQDSYYKDQSSMPFEERCKKNYDHPDAFDNELLIDHLKNLIDLNVIEKPIYDFEAHNRKEETIKVKPRDIIIVEGILVLQDPRVRELLDIKIYVDTDADVRIIRRLLRDINERGRTVDSVINQYLTVVRPMHMQFIEPSKRYADIIIPEGGHNRVAVDMMVANIKHLLQE